jgi:uncharacterized protein YjeT (DUF2065 family)
MSAAVGLFLDVLKVALTPGEHDLIPPLSRLSKTSTVLTFQGVTYFCTGLLIFLAPEIFNKIMLFPEPFLAVETPIYRMFGFCIVAIGSFYIMASRMDDMFFAIITIFTRMTMVPIFCLTLLSAYGGAPQLCLTFAILDPILALWTYFTMKGEMKDPHLSIFKTLTLAISAGEGLIPDRSKLNETSKVLIFQGMVYLCTGLLIFFAPGIFNKIMFFPSPFTEEETPLYRSVGFCLVGIGYFYIMTSRMNHIYWAVVTIFNRMTMSPACCLILLFVYGGAPQLCITFAVLDPILAIWTYSTLKTTKVLVPNTSDSGSRMKSRCHFIC